MQQDHNYNDDRITMPHSEQRYTPASASGHITGVEATSGGLIKATVGAVVAAGFILTVFWLPAEYGIDPTGAGRALGLTQMGEIKQQLYAEAAADDAAAAAKTPAATKTPAAIQNNPEIPRAISRRLDKIEAQLSSITTALAIAPTVETPTQVTPQAEPEPSVALATPSPAVTEPAASAWRDEVNYTLPPGQGVEIKLVMDEGATADFSWSANGGALNYDTHGDGSGNKISYEKGRSTPEQTGKITAAFTGNHGWFWRNRGSEDVVLTLSVRGEYSTLKLPE